MAVEDRLWAGTEASFQTYRDADAKLATLDVRSGESDEDEDEDKPYLLDVQGSIGVISIKGSLTNRDSWWNRYLGVTGYNDIRRALVAAASNPEIHAILLDIDSGGGAVNGVMDTSNLIRTVHDKVKPVYAFADGAMASGAYWLGMAAGSVHAGKTAVVGSIGVISTHMEVSKQLKDDGVGVTVMRAGKYKALANPYEPLSVEGKAALQTMLDTTYNVFIEQVADMRGKTVQHVDEVMAQGREFIGEAAVGAGLVDSITTYDTLVSQIEAQMLDMQGQFKQKSYQQQDPYQRGQTMPRKALTQNEITALAEAGLSANAEAEQPKPQEAPETVTPEAETTPTEVEVTTPVEAQDETAIVAFLQSQIADKDKALLEANVELSQIRKEHTEFTSVVNALADVVAKSASNLSVALGGTAIDASGMPHLNLLAEHKRLSDQFITKFNAGGVAAVDAAETTAESHQEMDPLMKMRLAAVRSTAKAK